MFQGEDRRETGMYFALAQCGMEMVAPMILGILLDSWLHTMPWITCAGVVFGFVGGLWHMVIMSNKIAEYEKKKRKPKMKKYVLTLTAEALDSQGKLEVLKETIGNMGARNIEVHGMGLVTVDSEVPLNFAAVDGVEASQEVQEAGTHAYVLALNDDADPEAVEKAVYALGAVSFKLHDPLGVVSVGSNVQLDLAELTAIAGVKHARTEQGVSLVRPVTD